MSAGLESAPLAAREGRRGKTLFAELPASLTGLVTENAYQDPETGPAGRSDPRVWADRIHEFDVGPVGTGIAVGDFDNDGRPDIFVVSKTESCRLFRNLGGFRFEDVTERAGVGDQGEAARIWKQGATFVDVNNDGRLDLYVCRFNAPNLLYINQGDGTFKEEAAARGLAVKDASVMAAFCDYDRDGFLDVFIQTNLLDASARPNGQSDYLFHNNGDGTYTDVTAAVRDLRGRPGPFGDLVGLRRRRLARPLRGERFRAAGQALPQQPRRDVHRRDRRGRPPHAVLLHGLGPGRREQRRPDRFSRRGHGGDDPPEGPADDGGSPGAPPSTPRTRPRRRPRSRETPST